MRNLVVMTAIVASLALPTAADAAWSGSAGAVGLQAAQQQQRRGRGDDLARIRSWRTFLDRAQRAFTAAHMSTTAVQQKIDEADARIRELRAVGTDDEGGRSDITGDVAFLERAQRAFTAAHMSTTDVNRWLRQAREAGG